ERQRRLVLAEMLKAEAAERNRIATELHDDTVQVLASALVALDRLIMRLESNPADDEAVGAQRTRDPPQAAAAPAGRPHFELRPAVLEAKGSAARYARSLSMPPQRPGSGSSSTRRLTGTTRRPNS